MFLPKRTHTQVYAAPRNLIARMEIILEEELFHPREYIRARDW